MTRAATQPPLIALLIIFFCLAIYWPGLSGPFLFDDKPALAGNELVQIDGATFDEWRAAALSSRSGILRRPLAMASFAANYVVDGGFSRTSLKTTNLFIHLAIAILLYFFFARVLDALAVGDDGNTRRLLALTGAAIWLLHPLNVSTVLYAVQRMAQLACLFTLAGLLVFMHYRQRWATAGAPPAEVLAAALWLLLLTTLAALSKENGALLPWLIIVLEVCVFRGVWAGDSNKPLRIAAWILLVLPLVLIVAVLAWSPESIVGGYVRREFTLEQRLLTQARLLWRYVGWICLPNIYDMGFQHDDIPLSTGLLAPVTTILSLLGWLLLLVLSFLLRRRSPLLLLAALFFLVGHSMESSVLPLEMVYEHRNYLPGTLLCLALASVVVIPAARAKRVSVWYPLMGTLVILGLLLFVRVQTWSDELTLSRINLAQHPESSRSNYFYANALLRRYRRGDQLGLEVRDKTDSLLLSRHYFERMYQTNERDVAALVMLFYLDSHYFSEFQGQIDWLQELDELLAARTMQASDWNALALFFELVGAGPQLAPQAQVMAMLDKLSQRYPRSVNVLRYRYQYLAAMNAPAAQLLPLLQRARELSPGTTWIYYALLREQGRSQDVAGMYESARLWLHYDPQRYSVNVVKSLFSVADPAPGASHE